VVERVDKSWGHELLIHNKSYCMKLLVYEKPIASSLHFHELKHECFYVSSGHFMLEMQGKTLELKAGSHAIIPSGRCHRLRCLVPGTVVEASSHDDPEDCVRLIPSEA